MGDAQGQGGLIQPVFFLDENHSGNPHLHAAFEAAGVLYEKHLEHFPRGVDDTIWLPEVAKQNWVVLTADTRIRYNSLERLAVRDHQLRLFYFSRNDFGGAEMGLILQKALPKMIAICSSHQPPFAASISRKGEVTVRDDFSKP
jgi:hypothetical protein